MDMLCASMRHDPRPDFEWMIEARADIQRDLLALYRMIDGDQPFTHGEHSSMNAVFSMLVGASFSLLGTIPGTVCDDQCAALRIFVRSRRRPYRANVSSRARPRLDGTALSLDWPVVEPSWWTCQRTSRDPAGDGAPAREPHENVARPQRSQAFPIEDRASQALPGVNVRAICLGCGRCFLPARATQRHCRPSCRVLALRARREKPVLEALAAGIGAG